MSALKEKRIAAASDVVPVDAPATSSVDAHASAAAGGKAATSANGKATASASAGGKTTTSDVAVRGGALVRSMGSDGSVFAADCRSDAAVACSATERTVDDGSVGGGCASEATGFGSFLSESDNAATKKTSKRTSGAVKSAAGRSSAKGEANAAKSAEGRSSANGKAANAGKSAVGRSPAKVEASTSAREKATTSAKGEAANAGKLAIGRLSAKGKAANAETAAAGAHIVPDVTSTDCYAYAHDVVSGKIKMGKRVVQACQRFLSELEASRKPSYPWRFDVELGYRPIRFIEKFLVPTKGDYSKMQLLPWQHFVEANMYGWVSKKTGKRRFHDAVILVGSGNGKSTLVVGNAIFGACKDGERGAEVYCLANSKEQARIIFDEVEAEVRESPSLRKHLRITKQAIFHDPTNSWIKPLATDSKTQDGKNVHLAIFDELQEYRDYKLMNVINKKRKKRSQPLSIYISTFGNVIDGPLFDYYEQCAKILDNDPAIHQAVKDSVFAFICEIDEKDEPEDVSCWGKANPSMGVLLKREDLILEWEKCKLIPSERADFINKQLNVFTSIDELSLFDLETILKNKKHIPLSELENALCYGGFDLSETEDFTAACLIFPLPNAEFFVLCHSWVPEKKVKQNAQKLDWEGLEKDGALTVVRGDYVNYALVLDWFVEKAAQYRIESIGYDPAKAFMLVQELQQKGFVLNQVRQGELTLTAPLDSYKERFLDGSIIYNQDRMFRWYLTNVKLSKRGETAVYLPTKRSKTRKIDGFAASLNAYVEYHRQNPITITDGSTLVTKIKM